MKSSTFATSRNTQLAMAAMMVLCLVAPATAQFEVSPDHFDGAPNRVTTQASPQQLELQAQIAEQNRRILDSYYSQIKIKSQEVQAIWQDLIAHRTEAGQDLALQAGQKELERLRNALAAQITTGQATLAYLENHKVTLRAQARPVPVPEGVRPARARSNLRRGTTLQSSLRAAQ
jgi:exonuclease VII large subunit